MPGLTDEQIEAARSVDLLAYLENREPGSIRKSGSNEYCLAEHDSSKSRAGSGFGSRGASAACRRWIF